MPIYIFSKKQLMQVYVRLTDSKRLPTKAIHDKLEPVWAWAGPFLCKINSSPPSATYMSVNRVSIGSDNGLSPIRRHAII